MSSEKKKKKNGNSSCYRFADAEGISAKFKIRGRRAEQELLKLHLKDQYLCPSRDVDNGFFATNGAQWFCRYYPG